MWFLESTVSVESPGSLEYIRTGRIHYHAYGVGIDIDHSSQGARETCASDALRQPQALAASSHAHRAHCSHGRVQPTTDGGHAKPYALPSLDSELDICS
jgi:hypothetical protein